MENNFKKSFQRYLKAGKEKKQCKEPCLKNGKSDRYCFDCASEILEPIIPSATAKKSLSNCRFSPCYK